MTSRSNQERDDAGVIVTLAHRDTGNLVTVTRPGFADKALREALELFDPTEYRVSAISTPRTILADLQGRRTRRVEYDTKRNLLDGTTSIEYAGVSQPEPFLLARVGMRAYQ